MVLLAAVAVLVVRPFGLGYEQLDPVRATVHRADPLTLDGSVSWPSDGPCPGELHPVISERDDRIIVERVERRVAGRSGCASVGTDPGNRASTL